MLRRLILHSFTRTGGLDGAEECVSFLTCTFFHIDFVQDVINSTNTNLITLIDLHDFSLKSSCVLCDSHTVTASLENTIINVTAIVYRLGTV